MVDDDPAFELSFWCGTCPFLFERLAGSQTTISPDDLQSVLADGDDLNVDDVIETFGSLLPVGRYLPLISDVTPRLTVPGGEHDYFAHEQVTTWGLDAFWGLPISPRVPYYRTLTTPINGRAHLYEFVVPMVPPSWNGRRRVDDYCERLEHGSTPVAVATLDVCEPAVSPPDADHHAHWGVSHFLLDGHHKLEAAARLGRPIRLLSLVSLDASLADEHEVLRLPDLRAQPMSPRPARD